MLLALLLAALPAVYWTQPVSSAPALKEAGVTRVLVPPERVEEWKAAGVDAAPISDAELESRVVLRTPGIRGRADVASATHRPWIDTNGWRIQRSGGRERYRYRPVAGKAALSAAEAYAWGADAVVAVEPAELGSLGGMLAFLAGLPAADLPGIADVGIEDDGSALVGEVLNLAACRNLLIRPDRDAAGVALQVKIGTTEFPRSEALNPDAFSLLLRRRLGEGRRSLHLYGSEVVLARLTGDGQRLRLQLVNYGGRSVEGLRVRLRGAWAPVGVWLSGQGKGEVEDYARRDGTTELSLATVDTYGLIDLAAAP